MSSCQRREEVKKRSCSIIGVRNAEDVEVAVQFCSRPLKFDDTCKPACPPQIISTIYPRCYKCRRSLEHLVTLEVRFDDTLKKSKGESSHNE